MRKHFVFIGAPGSGKGTQAEKVVKENGFDHISTGNLFRAEVAKGSELGKRVDEILKAGQLVPDELTKELLLSNINLDKAPLIFDGYPRNLQQAKVLSEILGDRAYRVIFFEVNIEALVARLTSRISCRDCGAIYNLKTNPTKQEGICDKCQSSDLYQRADDVEEVVRKRQEVYKETVAPVLDYYNGLEKLVKVDANRSVEDIYKDILKLI